jgi:hypothetical protein
MQKLWFLVAALIFAGSPAFAQAPANGLPQGRQIAGWAVEAIPVNSGPPGALERNRNQGGPNIAGYAGQSGIVRNSIAPNAFSSSQFEGYAGGRQTLVFNGRAFLRVQAPQRYVFVASIDAFARSASRDCEFLLFVGGKRVVSGRFPTRGLRIHNRSRDQGGPVLSGNADLQPGFYPIEFVSGCPWSYEPAQLDIQFAVRDERDAAPRSFADGELIHIQR